MLTKTIILLVLIFFLIVLRIKHNRKSARIIIPATREQIRQRSRGGASEKPPSAISKPSAQGVKRNDKI